MNKKLLTLAVAGVLAGGLGVAQADVTVYGLAHMSLDMVKDTCGSAIACATENTNIASNGSRLGFKGSEDLGSGLKAIWQFENQLAVDGETGTLSARNRFAGLNGGFGTVLMGIHDTPLKLIGRAVELFPEYVGDARNITAQTDWDLRAPNVIAYATPNMGGFGIMAAYVTDWLGAVTGTTALTNTDNDRFSAYSVNATYTGGPLYVGLAYEEHDLGGAGAPAVGASGTENMLRLTASGTFGPAKVVALYQKGSDMFGVADTERATYGVGGSFTMGSHVIKAQYYMADDSDVAAGTATDNGAKMMAVGYDFNFSKSTTAYVAYAKTKNDTNATFTVNSGGHGDATTPAADSDPSVISVGMIVKF
jgi:predicted porin